MTSSGGSFSALFSSFGDAWASFTAGGQLTPMSAWRERLTAGRAQFLSFQVPLGETAVADEVAVVQEALADVEGLAMYEPEMLHISLRGVGFQVIAKNRPDDVTREDVGRVTKQAGRSFRGAKPVAIEVGPVNAFHDALILEVRDGGALGDLRRRLAETVEDSFGIGDAQYLPHVTIAMFEDPAACAPALRERLPALRERAAITATVKSVELARWWFTGHDDAFPERDPVREYRLR